MVETICTFANSTILPRKENVTGCCLILRHLWTESKSYPCSPCRVTKQSRARFEMKANCMRRLRSIWDMDLTMLDVVIWHDVASLMLFAHGCFATRFPDDRPSRPGWGGPEPHSDPRAQFRGQYPQIGIMINQV